MSLSCRHSRVWIDYVGDTSTQLMYFPLQQHWLLLSECVRNVNLNRRVQSKWKIGERQSVLQRN